MEKVSMQFVAKLKYYLYLISIIILSNFATIVKYIIKKYIFQTLTNFFFFRLTPWIVTFVSRGLIAD